MLYDNSTMMLLNLLKILEVKEIELAGFDGRKENEQNNVDDTLPNEKKNITYFKINKEITKLIMKYRSKTAGKVKVRFITPSIYETCK